MIIDIKRIQSDAEITANYYKELVKRSVPPDDAAHIAAHHQVHLHTGRIDNGESWRRD